jgi:hypothetical protein
MVFIPITIMYSRIPHVSMIMPDFAKFPNPRIPALSTVPEQIDCHRPAADLLLIRKVTPRGGPEGPIGFAYHIGRI